MLFYHFFFTDTGNSQKVEEGKESSLSVSSTAVLTFRDLFSVLHPRWLLHNCNYSTANYQNVTFLTLGISIWLKIDCVFLILFISAATTFFQIVATFELESTIIRVLQAKWLMESEVKGNFLSLIHMLL